MAVRPNEPRRHDARMSTFEEDEEDHLATVIMADRTTDDVLGSQIVRPTSAPPFRTSRPVIEAEGVLVEEEPTPNTEQRYWATSGLSPMTTEWEVTEQMPMPSETPPQLRRAVQAPKPPTLEPPLFDITPEMAPREHGEWSEASVPASLNTQPHFEPEDSDVSFAPLIALLAIPAMTVFAMAMWAIG